MNSLKEKLHQFGKDRADILDILQRVQEVNKDVHGRLFGLDYIDHERCKFVHKVSALTSDTIHYAHSLMSVLKSLKELEHKIPAKKKAK